MKRLIVLLTLLSCAGCGDDAKDKAAAMRALVESCNAPVQTTLTLSSWGNTVAMTCAETKPMKKEQSHVQ